MTRAGSGTRSRSLLLVVLVVLALGGWLVRPRPLRPPALSDRDQLLVQRAALLTLFVSREHATQLVFWSDRANLSPTLQLLRESGVQIEAEQPDTAALAMPVPVHLESLATLEQHFRARPDGWESWFARFPGSSGLVALTRPVVLAAPADRLERVAVVVARTCGEHCHSAWRLILIRPTGHSWQVQAVKPLALPRD
ncbi:hypothetical protein [Gemmatimonas sp.]|uniref:hypothetical protein n=1 Tax=Gemmatimonas sp. TaxID=1962908 RepID=UPI0039834EB4